MHKRGEFEMNPIARLPKEDDLPLPRIIEEKCTGCGRCVDVCPTNALARVGEVARLVRPEACTYCTICQDLCPENAIELPFVIVFV